MASMGVSQQAYGGRDKRPYNSTFGSQQNPSDFFDDVHEPPRKRAKSLTPGTNGQGATQPKKDDVIVLSSDSDDHRRKSASTKDEHSSAIKSSPWKNRPEWLQSTPIEPARLSFPKQGVDPQSATENGLDEWNAVKDQARKLGWTKGHEQRLLDQTNGKRAEVKDNSKPNSVPWSQLPSGELASKKQHWTSNAGFKIGEGAALKFNPSEVSTIKHNSSTRDIGVARKQHDHSSTLSSSSRVLPINLAGTKTSVQSQHRTTPNIVPPRVAPDEPSASLQVARNAVPPSSWGPFKSPAISINVPLTEEAKRKRDKNILVQKLKQDVKYAKLNIDEVDRMLGLTGFSTPFQPGYDKPKLTASALPKKRAIDRKQIHLELENAIVDNKHNKFISIPGFKFVHPLDQAKSVLTARFSERFQPPLTFTNTLNDRRLNGKFQFISEYVLRPGVKVTGPTERRSCTCTGKCNETCFCLQRRFGKGNARMKDIARNGWMEQVPQYEMRPDGLIVLREDFIQRHKIIPTFGTDTDAGDEDSEPVAEQQNIQRVEISECNDDCSCDKFCMNRVVQNGRTVPLDIFESGPCGFGVRSPSNLVRGQFIEIYLGEVITERELVRREEAAEAGSTSYIYSLDWFNAQQVYHIDGENFGSAMRFVNHSCDPNAGTFPVVNNKTSEKLHHVAFFALKDIPAGTEITIDYTPQAAGIVHELRSADEGMERCYCGSSNCRQMLWPPGKERKARKKIIGKNLD